MPISRATAAIGREFSTTSRTAVSRNSGEKLFLFFDTRAYLSGTNPTRVSSPEGWGQGKQWAYCRIPEFTALARTLTRFRELIWNTLGPGRRRREHGRAEGINTQLAALTSRARGFHSAGASIAMAELTCGVYARDCPDDHTNR